MPAVTAADTAPMASAMATHRAASVSWEPGMAWEKG